MFIDNLYFFWEAPIQFLGPFLLNVLVVPEFWYIYPGHKSFLSRKFAAIFSGESPYCGWLALLCRNFFVCYNPMFLGIILYFWWVIKKIGWTSVLKCFPYPFFLVVSVYDEFFKLLLERQIYRDKQRWRRELPFAGSRSIWLQWLELSLCETRSHAPL